MGERPRVDGRIVVMSGTCVVAQARSAEGDLDGLVDIASVTGTAVERAVRSV